MRARRRACGHTGMEYQNLNNHIIFDFLDRLFCDGHHKLLLVSPGRKVEWASAPAQAALRDGRGVAVDQAGRFSLHDRAADDRLSAMMEALAGGADCAGGADGAGGDDPARAPQPLLSFGVEGERPPNCLQLRRLPEHPGHHHRLTGGATLDGTMAGARPTGGDGRALFSICLRYSKDRNAPCLEGLQELHGLTPAEAKVAAAIIDGRQLKDYAETCGLSYNTAKWHLSNVMQKSGCKTRMDLVRTSLFLAAV